MMNGCYLFSLCVKPSAKPFASMSSFNPDNDSERRGLFFSFTDKKTD